MLENFLQSETTWMIGTYYVHMCWLSILLFVSFLALHPYFTFQFEENIFLYLYKISIVIVNERAHLHIYRFVQIKVL